MALPCPATLDDVFGPSVRSCRREFDFTLLFEQSILSIIPSGVCLLLVFIRFWQLSHERPRTAGNILAISKLTLIVCVVALQSALVAQWSRESNDKTKASIPAAALSLVVSIAFVPLSWLEHTRTIKPSQVISGYLLSSTLLDLAQLRTLWLISIGGHIPELFSALFATRFLLLCIEGLHEEKFLLHDEDKARSPEDKCGIVSRTFFLWLVRLIYHGARRTVKMEDLYPPPVDATPERLEGRLQKAWSQSLPGQKHRLLRVTARVIKARLLAPVIPRLAIVGFTICQPILLLRLIHFLSSHPSSPNEGYGLIAAYFLVYLGIAASNSWYYHQTFKFITAIRAGLIAMVYDKTTMLNASAIDKSSAVTIMSADIERIVLGLKSIHDIWANVVQVALASWLLERQTGVAIVAPVVIAAACGYLTLKVSEGAGSQQMDWLGKIEKRIDVTTKTISSMRGLKMSGLTDKLIESIQNLRKTELHSAGKYRWWDVAATIVGFFPVMISPVLTFAIFIAVANANNKPLDAGRMFSSLSLLTLMSQPLSMLFQSGPEIMSMVGCFGRIEKFIDTERRDDPRHHSSTADSEHTLTETEKVSNAADEKTENRSVSKVPSMESSISVHNGSFAWEKDSEPTLKRVDLSIPQKSLTMIVGPVGCGKSTLLKGLLGEVPYCQGSINIKTDSVSYCDQSPWIINETFKKNITMFSDEDETFYSTVLDACALRDDLAQLSGGDESNLGSKGITLSGGQKQRLALARAIFARREISIFDDILSGLDATTQMRVFARVFGPDGLLRKHENTVVLATHAVHLLPFADHIVCVGAEGEIVEQGSFSELNEKEGYVRRLNISASRDLTSLPEDDSTSTSAGSKSVDASETSEEPSPPGAPKGVYRYYIKAVGRWHSAIYVLLACSYAFLWTFPYVWAKWWTDENRNHPGGREAYYMGIYAMLQVLCLTMLFVFARHAVITIITTSGLSLHWKLLSTTLSAPLSFFEKTDTGKTLNRFSQDLQMVDTELPMAALNIACSGLIVFGQFLLIINSSYWIALSFPALLGVIWVLQAIYLRTSRQLRHLDLESKEPLYSQFVESLDGLETIRAFNWQRNFKILNYENLDKSQRPFYLLLCIQRWLNLVLDCIATGFIVLLVGLIVGLRDTVSPGFTGVALSNVITLSLFTTNLVEVWTEMETSIASVQRIRDFEADTPSEIKDEATEVPKNWPDKGAIEIRNLVATYREGATKALKNFTMSIKAGEKIGVCGRTGSGKTSLLLSLFRMIDVAEGDIQIDGVDISSVDPNRLRGGLNAIPQEPFFMSGTIRLNADPSGNCSDEEILRALADVRLGNVIQNKGGLDAEMEDGTLSHGERQLFCLARAMLKQSQVIVLDEATSSIDIETEKLIQDVILERFKDFTVITIAHRLETILKSDRIALLDAGELIEFENPDVLLGRESKFKALYNTYGRE